MEHSGKDLNDYKSPSSTVYVSKPSKVIKIIEDVMLDISMYYTIFSEQIINQVEFRNSFSYRKVNQIKKLNLNSIDWDIDKNKGYIALAGYFWSGEEFDYIKYVELWEEIGSNLRVKTNKLCFPTVEEQFKLHKDYGELSMKSIIKKYNELSPGEYLFARLHKIPKRKIAESTLLSIFGGKVLKRGKWKFIDKREAVIFDNFINNVSLFKIFVR